LAGGLGDGGGHVLLVLLSNGLEIAVEEDGVVLLLQMAGHVDVDGGLGLASAQADKVRALLAANRARLAHSGEELRDKESDIGADFGGHLAHPALN
jgi:hypothetical protein